MWTEKCHHREACVPPLPPPALSNPSPHPSTHFGTYVRKSSGAVNSARPSVPLTDMGTVCDERAWEGWLLPALPFETSISFNSLNNTLVNIYIKARIQNNWNPQTFGGNGKWLSHSGKHLVVCQKVNYQLPSDPAMYSPKLKTGTQRHMQDCSQQHCSQKPKCENRSNVLNWMNE